MLDVSFVHCVLKLICCSTYFSWVDILRVGDKCSSDIKAQDTICNTIQLLCSQSLAVTYHYLYYYTSKEKSLSMIPGSNLSVTDAADVSRSSL